MDSVRGLDLEDFIKDLNGMIVVFLVDIIVSKFMIRNFFSPGGSVSWRDKVKYATDKPLGPEALLSVLGAKKEPEKTG